MDDQATLPADGEAQRSEAPTTSEGENTREADAAPQETPAQVDEKAEATPASSPDNEGEKEEPVSTKPAPYAPSITPTVGRVVLYTPPYLHEGEDEKHAAQIAKVLPNGTLNLGILSANGNHYARQGVPLIQDGEIKPDGGNYAEWMTYQKGQAAKTEELEKKIAGS